MLALKTIGKPVLGFITGVSLGAVSILAMNDIVYNEFESRLYGPVRTELEQGATTSDDFQRITKSAASSTSEFVRTVKPFAMKKVSVKKLFIEDEDYSTPEDHYFSYLRRRKQMQEENKQYGPEDYFDDPDWNDTHKKEDYQLLGQSTMKEVMGASMGIIPPQKEKIEADQEEEYIRANPEYARDSEDFDSRNDFGFFKITFEKPAPLQKSPERLKQKLSKSKAETPQMPKFDITAINEYMHNPNKMKAQIRKIEGSVKKSKGYTIKAEKKQERNLMLDSIKQVLSKSEPSAKEFRVVNEGVGLSSLDSKDKKRLHQLATKARYQ